MKKTAARTRLIRWALLVAVLLSSNHGAAEEGDGSGKERAGFKERLSSCLGGGCPEHAEIGRVNLRLPTVGISLTLRELENACAGVGGTWVKTTSAEDLKILSSGGGEWEFCRRLLAARLEARKWKIDVAARTLRRPEPARVEESVRRYKEFRAASQGRKPGPYERMLLHRMSETMLFVALAVRILGLRGALAACDGRLDEAFEDLETMVRGCDLPAQYWGYPPSYWNVKDADEAVHGLVLVLLERSGCEPEVVRRLLGLLEGRRNTVEEFARGTEYAYCALVAPVLLAAENRPAADLLKGFWHYYRAESIGPDGRVEMADPEAERDSDKDRSRNPLEERVRRTLISMAADYDACASVRLGKETVDGWVRALRSGWAAVESYEPPRALEKAVELKRAAFPDLWDENADVESFEPQEPSEEMLRTVERLAKELAAERNCAGRWIVCWNVLDSFYGVCQSLFVRWIYEAEARRRCMLALVASLAYELEEGGLPDSLGTLVAKGFLTSLPEDPFSGKALEYSKEERFVGFVRPPEKGASGGGKKRRFGFEIPKPEKRGSKRAK